MNARLQLFIWKQNEELFLKAIIVISWNWRSKESQKKKGSFNNDVTRNTICILKFIRPFWTSYSKCTSNFFKIISTVNSYNSLLYIGKYEIK